MRIFYHTFSFGKLDNCEFDYVRDEIKLLRNESEVNEL